MGDLVCAGVDQNYRPISSCLSPQVDQPRKITGERHGQHRRLMLLWLSAPWPETGARLSSDEVVIPATIPKTEGTVRERRERGFDLGASGWVLLLENEGATGGHGWRPASSWGALLGPR